MNVAAIIPFDHGEEATQGSIYCGHRRDRDRKIPGKYISTFLIAQLIMIVARSGFGDSIQRRNH